MSTRIPWAWHPVLRHRPQQENIFIRGLSRLAAFLGTPQYLLAQTVFIIVWITLNSVHGWHLYWDSYPYILLNLAFSTQAAYAAPIILYKQTRGDAEREAVAKQQFEMIQQLHGHIAESREADEQIIGKVDQLTQWAAP